MLTKNCRIKMAYRQHIVGIVIIIGKKSL